MEKQPRDNSQLVRELIFRSRGAQFMALGFPKDKIPKTVRMQGERAFHKLIAQGVSSDTITEDLMHVINQHSGDVKRN